MGLGKAFQTKSSGKVLVGQACVKHACEMPPRQPGRTEANAGRHSNADDESHPPPAQSRASSSRRRRQSHERRAGRCNRRRALGAGCLIGLYPASEAGPIRCTAALQRWCQRSGLQRAKSLAQCDTSKTGGWFRSQSLVWHVACKALLDAVHDV